MSQAFTIETGGFGGESVDRAGGGFLIQTAQLDLTKIFTGHQRGNMEVLSVLNLGDFAHIFSKMGMFPVFDLAYYIVSILYLKYEPGELTPSVCLLGAVCFQTKCLLYCFLSDVIHHVFCWVF